jgi:hypothetical protein
MHRFGEGWLLLFAFFFALARVTEVRPGPSANAGRGDKNTPWGIRHSRALTNSLIFL